MNNERTPHGVATNCDRDCSTCVFCDYGKLEPLFALPILGRNVQWMRCGRCRSIQVNRVDWLDEAYRDLGVNIDTGCAQRSILCSLYVRAMRAAGLLGRGAKVIDFGAGNGLLVRLLRDQGFEALGYDRYVRPIDCAGFTVETLDAKTSHGADLVTAIDVLEHLPYPRRTFADIAANLSPQGLVLLRTPLYQPKVHGVEWEHLGGEAVNCSRNRWEHSEQGTIGSGAIRPCTAPNAPTTRQRRPARPAARAACITCRPEPVQGGAENCKVARSRTRKTAGRAVVESGRVLISARIISSSKKAQNI